MFYLPEKSKEALKNDMCPEASLPTLAKEYIE
jgi:hypothetical protein